jgi:hypothetical protein
VNSGHKVFIEGIEQEKILEVTFFCRKRRQEIASLCAPLHYSKGPVVSTKDAEKELECYYLWDFGAEKGSNFLSLSPSQIISMKLTEDDFRIQDLYSYGEQPKILND